MFRGWRFGSIHNKRCCWSHNTIARTLVVATAAAAGDISNSLAVAVVSNKVYSHQQNIYNILRTKIDNNNNNSKKKIVIFS